MFWFLAACVAFYSGHWIVGLILLAMMLRF